MSREFSRNFSSFDLASDIEALSGDLLSDCSRASDFSYSSAAVISLLISALILRLTARTSRWWPGRYVCLTRSSIVLRLSASEAPLWPCGLRVG